MKMANHVLAGLRLVTHPDKTFIGRIAKGFDFLGSRCSPDGLRVATKTLANVVVRMRQLYERETEGCLRPAPCVTCDDGCGRSPQACRRRCSLRGLPLPPRRLRVP